MRLYSYKNFLGFRVLSCKGSQIMNLLDLKRESKDQILIRKNKLSKAECPFFPSEYM